jgi:hypothetical protein
MGWAQCWNIEERNVNCALVSDGLSISVQAVAAAVTATTPAFSIIRKNVSLTSTRVQRSKRVRSVLFSLYGMSLLTHLRRYDNCFLKWYSESMFLNALQCTSLTPSRISERHCNNG